MTQDLEVGKYERCLRYIITQIKYSIITSFKIFDWIADILRKIHPFFEEIKQYEEKIKAYMKFELLKNARTTKRQICYVTDVTRDVSDDTGVNVSDVTAWGYVTKRDVICVAFT